MADTIQTYSPYLSFPFSIDTTSKAPGINDRKAHIYTQIQQVLYTQPGERVFRHDFGVGVKQLVFEPNNPGLWEMVKQRLLTSLAQALEGEVDPRSIEVSINEAQSEIDAGKLVINIQYTLTRLGVQETHTLPLTGGV
jgi:phage baseplate assembly protein W